MIILNGVHDLLFALGEAEKKSESKNNHCAVERMRCVPTGTFAAGDCVAGAGGNHDKEAAAERSAKLLVGNAFITARNCISVGINLIIISVEKTVGALGCRCEADCEEC